MHINPVLIDRLVLTLAHFVWQGCLLAVLAWLVVDALGIRSVHKRYGLTLGLLIACIVLPCATLAIVEPGERPEPTISATLADTFAVGASETTWDVVDNSGEGALPIIIPGPDSDATSFPAEAIAFDGSFASDWQIDATSREFAVPPPALTWLQRNGRWFVLAWTVGVGALALRLILATVSATVLRWRGRPVEPDWQAEIDRLARRMKLHRAPNAKLSQMVRQVCVVGLYRPVILFPASWVSGVPADVLEAVIAHELAHIRRHDVWVIHVQRLVETLLFFHPAVWWISRQVSRHRELCCDADAAQVLGSPVKYATALEFVALKEYSGSQTLFMATLGGKKMELLERIQTVLGAEPTRPRRWQGSLAACLLLAGVLTAFASLALPGLTTSQADDESVAVDAAADEDEQPADNTSQPDSQPAPIGLESNIVLSAEVIDPADTPQVIERLHAAGITIEPVCDGSERYRIGGYVGLEFGSSDELSRITVDFRHLLDAKLLDDVIVSEEPEMSLADFKMGQWHQRRLNAELGYLPDELDVVGFLPHPHLRRFVVHDGAFEFITPQSQCSPEELVAIGAECTTLPIESSFHYDKQVNGVWWRVHGFREKPWLIVVEDVSPAATAVATEDRDSTEPSPLSAEEIEAMERLSAAGCLFEDRDGIPIGIDVSVEMTSPIAEDLVVLGNRLEEVRLSKQSITDENLLFSVLPALHMLELIDSKLSIRDADSNSVEVEAARICAEIDHAADSIRNIAAEEGVLLIRPFRNERSVQIHFDLMQFDIEVGGIRMEGATGVGPEGSFLQADSIELDLAASFDEQSSEGSDSGSSNVPVHDADALEQIAMTYAVGQFLTPVPGTEGEVTQASVDALKRLISTQVPAESWIDGEVPRIVYYPPAMSLIISQDRETHARIKQFLTDLELLFGGDREVEETAAQDESSELESDGVPGSAEQPLADTRLMSPTEQREVIQRLYQRYLQREPRENEYAVILSRLDRGQGIRDVEIDLIAGNEFYSRCEAESSSFIHGLHRQVMDRDAQALELQYWLSRLDHHGGLRREVASEFLSSVADRESQPQPATPTDVPIISPLDEPSVAEENRNFIEQFRDEFDVRPELLPDMQEWLSQFQGEYRPHDYREFLLSHGVDESQLRPLPQPATPREQALANALNEVTSLEADNTTLSDVMQMLSDQHGINVFVDEVALNEIGKTSDEPITVTIDGITLRSALNIICEPLEIGYQIDGEVLMITSRQRLEGEMTIATYPVSDIVLNEGSGPTPDELRQRMQRLADKIPLALQSWSWSQVGGRGSIHSHTSTLSLIVRQTPAVHRQVAALLEVLRGGHRTVVLIMKPGEVLWQKHPVRLATISGHGADIVTVTAISPTEFSITGVATGRTSFVVTDELGQSRQFDVIVSESDADTAALLNVEEQIEQALERRIELRVRQVPLNEALDIVSEQLGINIVLDEPGLSEYGVTANDEVSLSLRNIPARTVLELLLDPMRLGFVLQDEVVLVTNQARLQSQLEAVPYDVSDLIGDAEDAVEADLEEVAALLRSTVAPESWQTVGGQGSIIVIPWRKTLVVTQSPARHEAVEAVLASLRQAKQPVDQ